MVDFTETKLFEKIRDGNEKCIIFALSSPIARARGWGSQGTEFNAGDRPRINNFTIKFVTPESLRAERAEKVIEHRAVEDNRVEDELIDGDAKSDDEG